MRRFIVWTVVIGIIIIAWAMTLENETTYVFPESKKIEKVALRKELIPICACESVGRKDGIPTQFKKDGSLLVGIKNPHDMGMCQINVMAHEKELITLGLDVTKESDNIKFANWLYEREGDRPWNPSKPCWE